MGKYDEQILLAQTLLAEFGKTVTVRRFTANPAPLPEEPWRPAVSTPSDHPVVGCVFDYNAHQVDGTRVLLRDKRVIVAALDITPSPNDVLVDGTEVYAIVNVETLAPNGQEIIHTLQVRK